MKLRRWLRGRAAAESQEMPSGSALLNATLGRPEERTRTLGEYDADSYPKELAELLRRRQKVTDALLALDVTNPAARTEAILQLRELLGIYPHPIAYETLIHAYVDAERWDEARGIAFSAEARRRECEGSAHPEIQAETDRLRAWTQREIEEIRREREEAPSVVDALPGR